MGHDGGKHARRNGQVMKRSFRRTECPTQKLIGRGVLIIAIDVLEPGRKLIKRLWVHSSVMLQTVSRPFLQSVKAPPRLGDADDRNIEVTLLDQCLQCRENLFIGKVAGGAEKNERIGMFFHSGLLALGWVVYPENIVLVERAPYGMFICDA